MKLTKEQLQNLSTKYPDVQKQRLDYIDEFYFEQLRYQNTNISVNDVYDNNIIKNLFRERED